MRITLTKSEAASAAGIELLSLCSTITEDGRVTEQEIEALREWLQTNAGSDLPATALLKVTVDRIIADGRVLPEERTELHRTLERVLPKELRASAQAQRRKREIEDAVEAQRNAPVASFDFMVAGTAYEGRDRLIRTFAAEGQQVFLLRDPTNAYSRNAVKVVLSNGAHIGFVPEVDAVNLATLLDSGHKQIAWLKKIFPASRGPIPVVVAEIFLPDTLNSSAVIVRAEDLPVAPSLSQGVGHSPMATQSRSGCSCLGCGLVAAAVVLSALTAMAWAF